MLNNGDQTLHWHRRPEHARAMEATPQHVQRLPQLRPCRAPAVPTTFGFCTFSRGPAFNLYAFFFVLTQLPICLSSWSHCGQWRKSCGAHLAPRPRIRPGAGSNSCGAHLAGRRRQHRKSDRHHLPAPVRIRIRGRSRAVLSGLHLQCDARTSLLQQLTPTSPSWVFKQHSWCRRNC